MNDVRTACKEMPVSSSSTLKLCLKLYGVLGPKGNQCFSPAGLHQLLCLLVSMCNETMTKMKLAEILGFHHRASPQLNTVWDIYVTRMRQMQDRPLNISLALFSELKIDEQDLLGLVLKNVYHGDMIFLEKEKSPAKQVNEWIERATAGVIREIKVSNLDHIKTFLMNVVHFKAEWQQHLDWKVTPDVTFYVDSDKNKVKADFLNATSRVQYFLDTEKQVQVVKLDYVNLDFFLMIVLPEDMKRLEEEMTSSPDYLNSFGFRSELVSIQIPKFIIKSEINILDMLREICPDLKLDLYTGSKYGLYIHDIKQVNQIDVNEQGTEAVSVTCSVQLDGPVRRPPKPILFKADKPFVYFLCHRETILFAGRLCNPLEH